MGHCNYCRESYGDVAQDIFFEWLPPMFGIETEYHDFNPDVTVYISSEAKLKMTVMMGDHYVVKKETDILFCPFCGRKLREGSKKYKLTRYIHEWDDPVELGEFDSIDEAKKAGRADMDKVFCGRWFTTMEDWKETSYGLKNEALHGDDDYIYVIAEKEVTK